MMEQWINDFPQQLAYEPVLHGAEKLGVYKNYVVVGMGGSNLCTELLQTINPALSIIIHRDYGLPHIPAGHLKETLVILSSYSGTTEEVLDACEQARAQHLPMIAVTTGGALLARAKTYGIPYIQLPATNIPPRFSLGYRFKALLTIMGQQQTLHELTKISKGINTEYARDAGAQLSGLLENTIPLFYTSTRNAPLGYAWKIAMNENAKIPAFCNVIPEMNHNEMNGFAHHTATIALQQPLYAIILQDPEDHPRIIQRMKVLETLLHEQRFGISLFTLGGTTWLERIMYSIIIGMWTSYFLAKNYGIDPEPVPIVGEFKRLITK